MKKANGQIIACNEIFEEDTSSIKNFGVWIRYQSRTGFHNAYKEYREVSMNKAVDALYEEMASRHRVRAPCLQIIKICQVADADAKRRTRMPSFHSSSARNGTPSSKRSKSPKLGPRSTERAEP